MLKNYNKTAEVDRFRMLKEVRSRRLRETRHVLGVRNDSLEHQNPVMECCNSKFLVKFAKNSMSPGNTILIFF